MKRRVFFWLERLKITPAERKTVSTLVVLLTVLMGLNWGLSTPTPFGDEQYQELEAQFEKRTSMLEAKEDKLMQRYYPAEDNRLAAMKTDTVTEDSLADEPSKKEDYQPEKDQININTATKEALESLPGIGPTYAQRIISYRNTNGEFKTIDELKNIRGIAQKRLDKLKPFIKLKDPE